MELSSLIIDLAIMLMTAGVINIVFKRIHLPIILGYIVAGFLISPYFPLFMDVKSTSSIETWSEIGVTFLMFYIGLEFDLHKLARIGKTALISASVIMGGLIVVGYGLGIALGLNSINSLFLGVMISISSTAIIQKSFEELGMQGQKHTSLVMGTLIIEDVISVFLLIILPTISITQSDMTGTDLALKLTLMLFYLLIWLLLGIYFLPTFLNRIGDVVTDELVVILSTGLCFTMAIIATKLGFSPELGAFLTGSLMAGTIHVHHIESVTSGVKDLFGAIFFLSVGMMVDPSIIAERWYIILPVVVVAVLAKLFFASVGMLLSGQSLVNSLKSGFSLAPIGEFSFIIASLGISLGVMKDYMYSVIVSASIATILITPFLMKNAERFSQFINRKLPDKYVRMLESFTSDEEEEDSPDSLWGQHMRQYLKTFGLYGIIMLVAAIASERLVYPALRTLVSPYIAIGITLLLFYAVVVIFVRPMLDSRRPTFTSLWLEHRVNHLPLLALVVVKMVAISIIAAYPAVHFFHVHRSLIVLIILVAVFALSRTGFIASFYLHLETRFLSNFNETTLKEFEAETGQDAHQQLYERLHLISFFVPEDARYIGKTLQQLQWGNLFNVYIIKIRRGHRQKVLPEGNMVLAPGDKVYAVAEPASLTNFKKLMGLPLDYKTRTLRQFMDTDYDDVKHAVSCCVVRISGEESFAGKPIRTGGIRGRLHCMVLGLQKQNYTTLIPDPNMVIQAGDLLWVIGANNDIGRLISS